MNKIFTTVAILIIALTLMFANGYRTDAKVANLQNDTLKAQLVTMTLTKDSLINANSTYDTILNSILTDTNKITLNLDILMKNNPNLSKNIPVTKKKKGFFKRLFN